MKKTLLLIGLFIASLSINATVINVSSANDISSQSPSPGDTLLMLKSANWADQDIVADFNGTAANPIVLLAEGDGEVILSGGATLQIAGSYVTVSGLTFRQCASTEGGDLVKFRTSSDNLATNCRLTNCLFSDNNPSDLNTGYKWVSLYGTENRVDHSWFELKNHRGTTVVVWLTENDAPNFHRIDHNYFTRPELSTGNNEAETIRIGDSQRSLVNSNTIVEYNYFEECDGEIESISNKSCYNVYRHNTFFNNHSILTLRHGHFCTVENNFFFGNEVSGSGGVRIIGFGHKVVGNYMQDLRSSGNLRAPIVIMGGLQSVGINDATNRYVASEDNIVAFNTIVNCDGNAIYVGSDKTKSEDDEVYKAPSNNTIENNIIYGSSGSVLEFEKGEISSFSYSGNIYNGISLGLSNNTGFSDVDPSFTFGSGLNPARINDNSPAINASLPTVFSPSQSVNYTLPIEDMDGESRNGTLDVGADEYYSSTPLTEPITKSEVGPCFINPEACGNVVIIDIEDCNGVLGGTASIDDCEICSGGNTGIDVNSTCAQDCNGTYNGTASIDNCEVCSGGNTGIEADACLECNEPFATHEDGENVAINILDDLETRWSGNGVGVYNEICLGDTVSIETVSIAFHNGEQRSAFFDIDVSLDGINWTRILEDQESSGTTKEQEDYLVPNITDAWKLRFVGGGNSGGSAWNSVTKLTWSGIVTGTNETVNSKINTFPNPVSNQLHITGLTSNMSWNILNLQGKSLINGSSSTVNTSQLEKGIYLLELSNGETIKFTK